MRISRPHTLALLGAPFVLAASAALTRLLTVRAERRYPRPAGSVVVDGARLCYEEAGAGPPVVLVHGLLDSTKDFTALTALLARRYHVVAFDRPGSGYSGLPARDGHSTIDQARLLHEAAARLGLVRLVVVGYSLGAAVALGWAQAYPDDVAAVVTVAGHVLPYRLPASRLAQLLRLPVLGRLACGTLAVPLGYPIGRQLLRWACFPQPLPRSYADAALAVALRPTPLRSATEDLERTTADLREIAAAYHSLEAPVVIVVGRHDAIAPYGESAALHRRLGRSRLTVIDDGGHALHVTHPLAVIAAVDQAWELARPATVYALPRATRRDYEDTPPAHEAAR